MNAKAENGSPIFDAVKTLIAVAIVVGAVYGYYYFESQWIAPIRLLGVLFSVGLAIVVATTTTRGRALMSFMKAANIERQKVVWPTRQETWQTTLMVLVFVVIIGAIIWLLDFIFSSAVGLLVG